MQEPLLFNISIKDNIKYGNDSASDYEVRQVAKQANALEFIEKDIYDFSKEEDKKRFEKYFYSDIVPRVIFM